MKKVSDFLKKFQNLEHPDQKKESIAKVIFLETKLSIDKKEIEIRGKTLFLKSNPYIKSEIILRKDHLLGKIKENFPNLRIADIK